VSLIKEEIVIITNEASQITGSLSVKELKCFTMSNYRFTKCKRVKMLYNKEHPKENTLLQTTTFII